MSLLNQLAQVAQLAGSKRKLPHDVELDSVASRAYPYHPIYYSNPQPWLAPWSYPQPPLERANLNLRYQESQSTYTSSDSQVAAIAPNEQNQPPLLDASRPSVHCGLAHGPTQADALTNSSVSPSTERSFRNWQDSSSTTSTSYASSPNLDGSHFSHYGQYPYQFASFQNNYNYSSHIHPAAFPNSGMETSLRVKAGLSRSNLLGDGMAMNLDCAEDIPCSDPDCRDGIPCTGEHLMACDKDDCDDAIPCPGSHLPVLGSSSLNSIREQFYGTQDCSMSSSSDGFCCSDKCPQETRCPSPCFEQDCDVPQCAVEHVPQTSWEWTEPAHSNGSMNGCIDPRHTFHDHKSLESGNASWNKRLQEQLSFGLRSEDRVGDSCISTPVQRLRSHENPPKIGKLGPHGPQSTDALNRNDCSGSFESLHHHQSRRSARDQRHSCKWVLHGDSSDPNADICGLGFTDSKDLQEHVVSHVEGLGREQDLFPCRWQGCKHRFSDGFHARPKLKRHLMVHTGATPYKCDEPGCNVEMKTKDALDKHKRTHTGAKPYQCTHPHCESRFATSTELKTHLIVHSGQKPHRCPRCGDCFADSSNLSKHKKVHEVPKFKCPDCDYKMKRWDQMRRHFKSQGHALDILRSKAKEVEYKRVMQEAFDKLTPEEKMLPVSLSSREASLDPRGSELVAQSDRLEREEAEGEEDDDDDC